MSERYEAKAIEEKWQREDYVFPTEPEPDGATA